MNFISMQNYSKRLKGKLVLNQVNLSVDEATVIGLHGRNASGKTMLLRALSGLILPSQGKILINGNELRGKNRFPESCGLLIETIRFWPGLTAKSTLELLASINNKADDNDINTALIRVGLDPEDRRTVRKFSLGMKQKLAIAQAVFEKPDILLLDEPTNSLDEEARLMFAELIKEEKERGCTIIMASHIYDDLHISCDRILEIDDGVLRERVVL